MEVSEAMELMGVSVVTVVETLWPLPLLLSVSVRGGDGLVTAAAAVCVGGSRRQHVTDVGDRDDVADGSDGRERGGDALPITTAAVCVGGADGSR